MLVRKSGRWASRKLSVTHGILKLLANLYSIFVSGFGFGPLIWGPFSELFGRMVPLLVGFFIFAIFQIPVDLPLPPGPSWLCATRSCWRSSSRYLGSY
jgi:MFS family permease